MTTVQEPRAGIYYWKCDRPAAFYGLSGEKNSVAARPELERQVHAALTKRFPCAAITLEPGRGQGNHLTLEGRVDSKRIFVRIEDGPDADDYMDVESHVIELVRQQGVPAPAVLHSDSSRSEQPFAWQALEFLDAPDLNRLHKEGRLDPSTVAADIGAAIARWQAIRPAAFGPFNPARLREHHALQGYHDSYEKYFFARLPEHLALLVRHAILTAERATELRAALERHRSLLACTDSVLVHKDLALWNILGTPAEVIAYIDWNDAISGDATDDLSLLACFHDGRFLARVVEGYVRVRPLPADFRPRFWLHFLRNMIMKAVIRAGAGYFSRKDDFFLLSANGGGEALLQTTRQKLEQAARGLAQEADPLSL